MKRLDAATLLLLAFRVFGRAPESLSRGFMVVAADVAWLRHGAGVRQLEANLRRARPQASPRELRRLSRGGMRTYMRYFAEAFVLPRLTAEQIDARVRAPGIEPALAEAGQGRPVVLALAHQGNWDLAGAWATVHLAPATAVAERLNPPEVFEAFRRMRESVGMTIIPLDKGSDVFRELVRTVQRGNVLIPLVADRDLTSRGVEVELLGEPARVAVGPAALSIATGAVLVPTHIWHERLTGARRRAAGTRWGLVVSFNPPIPVPTGVTRTEAVRLMTQAWVDQLSADIVRHPTHWHMLQKVFVADLDPRRYAAETGPATTPAPEAATGGAP
jgi:KDO2-lipid IV(A) lauroyltransferase